MKTKPIKMRLFSIALLTCGAVWPVYANDFIIILPRQLPQEQKRLKSDLETLFLERLQPGGSLTMLDGSRSKMVGIVVLPTDTRYERPRTKVKKFGSEIQKMLDFIQIDDGGERSEILALETLSFFAEHRQDAGTPDLLIFGGAMYPALSDPAAAIRIQDGALLVPNERAIRGTLEETAYGTDGLADGLAGVLVHWCAPYVEKLSRYQHDLLHRIWALWLKAQGAALVTFTQDIDVCVDRFVNQVHKVSKAYQFSSATDTTPAMLRVRREPLEMVDMVPQWPRPEIDVFSQFVSEPHPYLKHVQVTTGTEYARDTWPTMSNSWCYTQFLRNGVKVKIDLGSRTPFKDAIWTAVTDKELEAAGISRGDAEAGRSACQFPDDPV